jgi:hypothetical protein
MARNNLKNQYFLNYCYKDITLVFSCIKNREKNITMSIKYEPGDCVQDIFQMSQYYRRKKGGIFVDTKYL